MRNEAGEESIEKRSHTLGIRIVKQQINRHQYRYTVSIGEYVTYMDTSSRLSLSGDLHVYPFGRIERSTSVTNHYQDLLQEYRPKNILCLTHLCSDRELTDAIVETLDTVSFPTVETLTKFATEILQAVTPGLTTLTDHERIELLAAFLDEHEWETDYLAAAAHQESFQQDVGSLLIEMESRDALSPGAYDSAVLQEIAAVGKTFQTRLTDDGYVDRPSLLPRATAELQSTSTADLPDSVTETEAILVADFEEFAQTERAFLDALTDASDAILVAIAERDSRLLSSWREAGDIESLADGLTITPHTVEQERTTEPHAVGEYLVSNERPTADVDDGAVSVIERGTFREQLSAVADEIERLCRMEGYEYNDITIAYQDSSGPVEETIRLLRRHGIPTTTIAVSQLGNDPAVKELYDLTKVCAGAVEETAQTTSRDRLLAHDGVDAALLETLANAPSAQAGLWHWVETTGLKHRTAGEWPELETREQFQHVKEAIQLAEFLDTEDSLDGSWDGFLPALERAFRYASTRLENIETDHDGGGVPVGTIYGLKHATSKAVFLLNVTDTDYPSTPTLTALLPTQRLQDEPEFPMLTTQSPTDVTDTFRPAAEPPNDPFHAYFAQISRRLLGVGARTAEERLYFGVPSESAQSLGTYLQPSRFLSELVETVEFIEPLSPDEEVPVASHGSASEFVVEHVDDTLESVRRASVGGDTVDLDAYERELAAIDTLLDQPEAEPVYEALAARITFRRGEVRRD